MNTNNSSGALEQSRIRFLEIAEANNLLDASVCVLAKPLTPQEAIGEPGRRDFPIITGKERVVESVVLGSRGHAFTDSPGDFSGSIEEVLAIDLGQSRNRAIYLSTLNAVLSSLKMVGATVHCRDDEPERCAREIASYLLVKYKKLTVGLIGLNPAIAEALVATFGTERIRITDLNKDNIGKLRFGVEVQDGETGTEELVKAVDLVLLTGTTLTNDTFDQIWTAVQQAGKKALVYGVSAAAVSKLVGFERICPLGRDQ